MLKKYNINAVNINGEHIARSDKVKYMGGFLDSTLSFHQHVIVKCHAANINWQNIRHIRKFLTKDTCQQLVQSLVMSHLDYANAILSGIPKMLINIMQCTQNWAARITIGKTKIGNDSATEIRSSLHWLPIRERIDFKIATYIYKCQNNQAPMHLQKFITEKKIKHPGWWRHVGFSFCLIYELVVDFLYNRIYFFRRHKLSPILLIWLHLVYGKMFFLIRHLCLMVSEEKKFFII